MTSTSTDSITWPAWPALHDEALALLASSVGSRPPEVRWLIEEATGQAWTVSAHLRPTAKAVARFHEMVARRAAGEPLQYVLGHWSFRNLDLMVDPRVLIPRPETEQVVEVALAELHRIARRTPGEDAVVVDLGTGSGAIALAIAAEYERAHVWATDSQAQALEVARANLAGLAGAGLAATRVRMREGHWWQALPGELRHRVDLVVSNPPYITSREMVTLDRLVADWEPRTALESGPTGLEAVAEILTPAREDWLASHGTAVIEIAPHQARGAQDIAARSGFTDVTVYPDLSGRDRVLVARP